MSDETARGAAVQPLRSEGKGPTDIRDDAVRLEAKKAAVWIGMTGLVILAVYLAQPLLVIFGGIVFGTLIDGGQRLLGRVLPIGRIWRVAIVLLLTVAFLVWVVEFAGSQIASQAAQMPPADRGADRARARLGARPTASPSGAAMSARWRSTCWVGSARSHRRSAACSAG